MSKAQPSKLDPFAERLDVWFAPREKGGDAMTLAQAREQLMLDGCNVSTAQLSRWWQRRQSVSARTALLAQIASGAAQIKEMDRQFGRNPAPEVAALIKTFQVLILKLATEGNLNPEMLELANSLMKPVLEFGKLETKRQELALAQDKFYFDAAKLALAAVQKLKTISASKLSDVEKIDAARKALFGELPETN